MHLIWRRFGPAGPFLPTVFVAAWLLGGVTGLGATPAPPPATGANVDESRVQQTLYVDPANADAADDDRHGTSADTPFATLRYACGAAVRFKDANRGVKLVVAAGTYRETAVVDPPSIGKADTDAPLVIEAAERDQTVVDGADTEGWTPSTWQEADGRWTHSWPFPTLALRPTAAQAAELRRLPPTATSAAYRHGALLLVNGTPLRQVNAAGDLQPGTFLLQGSATPAPAVRREGAATPSGAGGTVVLVHPPADTPLTDAIIQVGVRPIGLTVTRRRNVVVRGLLFQHTAAPALPLPLGSGTAGLAFDGCANVLVEDVLSQWHDGGGLRITGTTGPNDADFTLRRVRLLHNGGVGLSVEGGRNLLAEDCEASFNNFRGDWGGWIDPQRPAGVKAVGVKGSTWRRQRTVGNVCRGLWFREAADLTVEEAVVRDNAVSGVLFDHSPGPTLLRRSLISGTKPPSAATALEAEPAAVAIYACPDVTLESNVLVANQVPGLGLGSHPPGLLPPAAPPPGRGNGNAPPPLRAERHTLRRNVVYGQTSTQLLCDWPALDRTGTADFSAYYPTLVLEENSFWNPAASEVFVTYGKGGVRPAACTFEAWMAFLAARAETGGKAAALNSHWQDPLFLDPAEGDFRLQENSPIQDWDLLVDQNSARQ